MIKYSFDPLVDNECTILILGSLPGEESLNKQQYYANPRNLFWKILFDVLKVPLTDNYEDKCRTLLKHHIALWDMVRSGNRTGSLDVNIKNEEINDLREFCKITQTYQK